MINRALVIRGSVWGERLQRRLNKPPVGLNRWLEDHTHILKEDDKHLVAFFLMRDLPCYLKLYRRKSWLQVPFHFIGRGRAVRTFTAGVEMVMNGVPIPRPLTCVLLKEGVLVLSKGITSGGDYFSLWQEGVSEQEAVRMMEGAGESIAALHATGYSHGDCKWSNLLWSGHECLMVDLDGARRRALGRKRRQMRDLARFTVSAEEAGVSPELLELFFKSYESASGNKYDELVKRMQQHLRKFRTRHQRKYGIAAQPLV